MQDEACTIFKEIKGQGSQLDQMVIKMEQCLERPTIEKLIQEISEQEVLAKKQVEEA
jgi:hypothetical protein